MNLLGVSFGLAALGVLLGIAARTLVPYLLVVRDNPGTKFDRKFVVSAVVSLALNLLMSPLTLQGLPETGGTVLTGFLLGWGATDVVREAQKRVAK